MLQVSNLSKTYGTRTLFSGVTFSLVHGERLGLVGRNGSGKSTLFRIILGEEHQDEGQITAPRGYRIGHLAQHLVFTEPTVLGEACLGLAEEDRDQEWRAEIILNGLGFSESDLQKSPAMFSGGFQIRINLAKLLLSEPNLLLLDEPTNYLDIISMRWLGNFLKEWENEIIIISHDRSFMDSVTTHTMSIQRGSIRKMQGGTSKLYSQVQVDEEIYEKTRLNEEKKRKELEAFITRFRAQASKAALVQSKVKALERMGVKEELKDEENLDFWFCSAPHPGKILGESSKISFHYPQGPDLINDLSLTIGKNDRIGVIGKNGKGKSTLLKLLGGEIKPTSGSISYSPNAKIGYFGQTNISRLKGDLTVEQEIESVNLTNSRTKVRAICGTMMFKGDDALKKVSVLSGGEKSRVLLGKILAEPTNLLLLDEPTNHLDMESIEALVESLKSYEGAVVIVTHSEFILRQLATRLVVFQGEKPFVFDHEYDYFLEKEGWGDETEMTSSAALPVPLPTVSSNLDEKAVAKLQKKIKNTEDRICTFEREQKVVEENLATAYQTQNTAQIAVLNEKLKEIARKIEEDFTQLEALSAELSGNTP